MRIPSAVVRPFGTIFVAFVVDIQCHQCSAFSASSVVLVVPAEATGPSKFGTLSPIDSCPTYEQAAQQLGKKLSFYNAEGDFRWRVCTADTLVAANAVVEDGPPGSDANVIIALGLSTAAEMSNLQTVFEQRRQQSKHSDQLCHFTVDCCESLPALVGPLDTAAPIPSPLVLLPWTQLASAQRLHDQLQGLFERWTTDDFCYGVTLFLNQFVAPVDWVRHRTDATWEKGPVQNVREFYAMATQCNDCLVSCVQDDQCRTCLSKLTELDPRDQATSYRTIVSYESDLLTKISLCMFTKKNIFQCDASIPTKPVVPPLSQWRGRPLTKEVGRSLLVGHLQDEATALPQAQQLPVSWKVACGANVAYDQFPSQNQLFYPAASSGTNAANMWYDPVFRVETLDGRHVWCKRHYRVQQQTAATFRLSVSDNGVTSDEFWTIVGAAPDLSWIVFHYAGAAKTIGQRYLGGLVCTPDGTMPPSQDTETLQEIWECLQAAGIEPWELYAVDNGQDTPGARAAGPPPLTFYRDLIAKRRKSAQVA